MKNKEVQEEEMEIREEETVLEAELVEDEEETTEESNEEETVEADKASEYLEQLQRLGAEYANYRKRTEKEKEKLYDLGVSSTVTELLGTVDNFERALQQTCEDEKFAEGMAIIYKQLTIALEKLNVTPIEAEGQTFDPEFHSAVMLIEDENLGENIVAKELQKGYCYKGKVIRHSMVQVANS